MAPKPPSRTAVFYGQPRPGIVGANLTRIRTERGYTKARVARDVFGHGTGSYISQIELGRKHPADKNIARLEDYLGVPRGTLKQHPAPPGQPGKLPGT